MAGVGYTQHGVCSFVYMAKLRAGGPPGALLAIKVMHNLNPSMHQTVAIAQNFSAEHELLSDVRRLPLHPNIMSVLRVFTDDASSLPDWNFGDDDVVQRKTMMLVMPFVERDLLYLLGAARRAVRSHPTRNPKSAFAPAPTKHRRGMVPLSRGKLDYQQCFKRLGR